MKIDSTTPGLELYRKVRCGFILKGTTLNHWCRTNGTDPQNARQCLTGSWDGPRARELRATLIKASALKRFD